MDIYFYLIIGSIFGYLCGSIPFGLIIGKLFFHTDVRNCGSGNLGSTNVARSLGAIPGLVVALLDALKGGLPAFIMYQITCKGLINSSNVEIQSQISYASAVYLITAYLACVGHCHPLFSNFKGGKAVASCFGFLCFMNYRLAIVAIAIYLIVALSTKIISIASLSTAIGSFVLSFISFFQDCYLFKNNELSNKLSMFIYQITLMLLMLLILYRHIPNIERLIHKQEKKLTIKKKEK